MATQILALWRRHTTYGKIKASVRVQTVASYHRFYWLARSIIYDSYLTIHVNLLWCLKLVDTTVKSRNFAHFCEISLISLFRLRQFYASFAKPVAPDTNMLQRLYLHPNRSHTLNNL